MVERWPPSLKLAGVGKEGGGCVRHPCSRPAWKGSFRQATELEGPLEAAQPSPLLSGDVESPTARGAGQGRAARSSLVPAASSSGPLQGDPTA